MTAISLEQWHYVLGMLDTLQAVCFGVGFVVTVLLLAELPSILRKWRDRWVGRRERRQA